MNPDDTRRFGRSAAWILAALERGDTVPDQADQLRLELESLHLQLSHARRSRRLAPTPGPGRPRLRVIQGGRQAASSNQEATQ